MVDVAGYLSPPSELWTHDSIDQLDAKIGRPVPFFESNCQRAVLMFCRCYRIIRWDFYSGSGDKVRAFGPDLRLKVQDQHRLHVGWPDILLFCLPAAAGIMREVVTWGNMWLRDWAQVELEKVMDPILSGDLKHRYILC